jgi:hypothetical protein
MDFILFEFFECSFSINILNGHIDYVPKGGSVTKEANGFVSLSIKVEGKQHKVYLHELVAHTVWGRAIEGHRVVHKKGVSDNSYENLKLEKINT